MIKSRSIFLKLSRVCTGHILVSDEFLQPLVAPEFTPHLKVSDENGHNFLIDFLYSGKHYILIKFIDCIFISSLCPDLENYIGENLRSVAVVFRLQISCAGFLMLYIPPLKQL
jgi:hypothetical protein